MLVPHPCAKLCFNFSFTANAYKNENYENSSMETCKLEVSWTREWNEERWNEMERIELILMGD